MLLVVRLKKSSTVFYRFIYCYYSYNYHGGRWSRYQRRGKRKKVFTGIASHKLSKLDQDENNTNCDENVNVPPDVTASATAVSIDNHGAAASGSAGFPDEETEWIDIAVEEEIEIVKTGNERYCYRRSGGKRITWV